MVVVVSKRYNIIGGRGHKAGGFGLCLAGGRNWFVDFALTIDDQATKVAAQNAGTWIVDKMAITKEWMGLSAGEVDRRGRPAGEIAHGLFRIQAAEECRDITMQWNRRNRMQGRYAMSCNAERVKGE